MSLGNNRDYKTHARRITSSLARHAKRMAELVAAGMDREQASKQALAEMQRKPRRAEAR